MADWYVSPTGLVGNTGAIGSPWDLASGLSGHSGAIQPGDTIWMRGGVYTQAAAWVQSANGAIGSGVDNPDGKLLYRNFPGEKVSIETTGAGSEGLVIDGNYVWFLATLGQGEGIEVYRNIAQRTVGRLGPVWVRASTDGVKLIHVISRDGANGVFNGNSAGTSYDQGDLEMYGLISYNHGEDTAPRGHSFYMRHQGAKKLRLTGCIGFFSLGHGYQMFGNAGNTGLTNIELVECIHFGAGVLGTALSGTTWLNAFLGNGGSTSPADNCKVLRCVLFQVGNTQDEGSLVVGSNGAVNKGVIAQDNYVVGGFNDCVKVEAFPTDGSASLQFDRNSIIPRGAVRPVSCTQAGALAGFTSWTQNDVRRDPTVAAWRHAGVAFTFAAWQTDTGIGGSDSAQAANPTVNKVFVFKVNRYLPYAHVCFFNWQSSGTVDVNLADAGLNFGDSYEVYNVQDIFGAPVLSGVYQGGTVAFPTTGKAAPTPNGVCPRAAPATAPFFDAFFVRRTAVGQVRGISQRQRVYQRQSA